MCGSGCDGSGGCAQSCYGAGCNNQCNSTCAGTCTNKCGGCTTSCASGSSCSADTRVNFIMIIF